MSRFYVEGEQTLLSGKARGLFNLFWGESLAYLLGVGHIRFLFVSLVIRKRHFAQVELIFVKGNYREGRLHRALEHGVGVVFGGLDVMVGVGLAERDLQLALLGEFCLLTFLLTFFHF